MSENHKIINWFAAADNNDVEMLKKLVESGFDVDTKKEYNETALSVTCENGHSESALYLISKGADINIICGSNSTCLIKACTRGNMDIIQKLVEMGADVNAINGYNESALYESIYCGNYQVAEYLVENGANINLSNRSEDIIDMLQKRDDFEFLDKLQNKFKVKETQDLKNATIKLTNKTSNKNKSSRL